MLCHTDYIEIVSLRMGSKKVNHAKGFLTLSTLKTENVSPYFAFSNVESNVF